jgi:hypothetical protein
VERVHTTLYQRNDPPGEPIPVHVSPFDIDDEVPTETEIANAVRCLKTGKAPGQTGMRAEHLKAMLLRASKENSTPEDQQDWDLVCQLVQHMFAEGAIPQELSWSVLVLIPKESGGMRGIGLLEVIWKVCSSIINSRLQNGIEYYEALHGFRKERGTGTAILQAKLVMQRAHIQQGRPLFKVFLDLSKAYDTLDRDRTLQVLEKYGVGPRVRQLLQHFWNNLVVVARQQGFYSQPIMSERGTTQGDIVSPTIFNIVVDAIVRAWYHSNAMNNPHPRQRETVWTDLASIFYADDGNIYCLCARTLQAATDCIVDLFARMGLLTNAEKTKAMVCMPGKAITRISSPAYRQRMGNQMMATYSTRKRHWVTCDICGVHMQARNLTRHRRNQHGITVPGMAEHRTPPHLANPGTTYK